MLRLGSSIRAHGTTGYIMFLNNHYIRSYDHTYEFPRNAKISKAYAGETGDGVASVRWLFAIDDVTPSMSTSLAAGLGVQPLTLTQQGRHKLENISSGIQRG